MRPRWCRGGTWGMRWVSSLYEPDSISGFVYQAPDSACDCDPGVRTSVRSPRERPQPRGWAMVVGQIRVELVFVRNKDSGSGVVPEEVYDPHMKDRAALGVKTTWWYDTDPA